jgi:hypothetical protein
VELLIVPKEGKCLLEVAVLRLLVCVADADHGVVVTQYAPRNDRTMTTVAQSQRNAVKQSAGVRERLRLRKLSG